MIWFYCLKNLLFFDIPLLYYYSNLRSSTFFDLCFGDTHLSFVISLSGSIFYDSFLTASELCCDEVVEAFVILFATLSPVASTVFHIAFLEAVLSVSVALSASKSL